MSGDRGDSPVASAGEEEARGGKEGSEAVISGADWAGGGSKWI